MRASSRPHPAWMSVLVLACAAVAVNGCSRTRYRLQADGEAYDAIAEKNVDPRWCVADYSIEIDPRSRYFDPYDPDRPPMPADDPSSHQYMHCVDGKRGWKHWHNNGDRIELENPAWREALGDYVELSEDGAVKLDVNSALKLAHMHAPTRQDQLETLYLSALDVSRERFRLDTQFFGGHNDTYDHRGRLLGESNTLALDTDAQLNRRFATAGEVLVGFANSFVFEFTGSDTNFASSIVNFSLVQPLLRGAGRDIALEQLTNAERALLANLRAYYQYRQGFYTRVAIGDLGVAGPRRGGGGTFINVAGAGGVGGYIGLLRTLQQKRNAEDNLSLQGQSLARLEAYLEMGAINLEQVDQLRQRIEFDRAALLVLNNLFQELLDGYKMGTLGLPPDLPIELDDSLIRQFQLVSREATAIEDSIIELQVRLGDLPVDVGVEPIRQILTEASELVDPVRRQLDDVQPDLIRLEEAVPARERTMTDEERTLFQQDREQLHGGLADLEQRFEEAEANLGTLRDRLSEQAKDDTVRDLVTWLGGFCRLAAEDGGPLREGLADSAQQFELSDGDLTTLTDELSEQIKKVTRQESVVWLGNLQRIVQGSVLVQARARLETVSVETIEMDSHEAFRTALANRMDFMNGRAALVDSWRSIQINADALQSVLNVTASGDIRTARNNPVSFRAPAGTMRLGMEFDAPFTRLLERNDYRQSLIDYQRNRRAFIQSCDSLHGGLRGLLRQIEQLRMDLEIQRRSVVIAIRRVNLNRLQLDEPVVPPQPGRPPAQFGRTAARDLLEALGALRTSQNALLSAWLNYYAAKMRLDRELGIMVLDDEGRWIPDSPTSSSPDEGLDGEDPDLEELPPPPPLPADWIELVRFLPQDSDVPHATANVSDTN
ncbi:MAG: hypothetical protein ISR77_13575 [Pirellulaceae bacterium]|nr:hypothetical protein [Pirellulaceae bacterium]